MVHAGSVGYRWTKDVALADALQGEEGERERGRGGIYTEEVRELEPPR
jgi:hypothetical protein